MPDSTEQQERLLKDIGAVRLAFQDIRLLHYEYRPKISDDITLEERRVWKSLAEGNTIEETAENLDLKAETVKAHKLSLMRKLDADGIWALQDKGVRCGLIKIPNMR